MRFHLNWIEYVYSSSTTCSCTTNHEVVLLSCSLSLGYLAYYMMRVHFIVLSFPFQYTFTMQHKCIWQKLSIKRSEVLPLRYDWTVQCVQYPWTVINWVEGVRTRVLHVIQRHKFNKDASHLLCKSWSAFPADLMCAWRRASCCKRSTERLANCVEMAVVEARFAFMSAFRSFSSCACSSSLAFISMTAVITFASARQQLSFPQLSALADAITSRAAIMLTRRTSRGKLHFEYNIMQ